MAAQTDFQYNQQTGNWEAKRDGVYELQADAAVDRVRIQMRKGTVVTPADAALFKRTGGWPDEPSAEDDEEAATGKARAAPANKAAPEPSNKAG